MRKVVLAYSGGLDTSIIVRWLRESYGCEVVTYTGNVGQADELEGLEAKALASGAVAAVIEDLVPEFVRDFVWPALRAGAVYEGRYLLGTSLTRRCWRAGKCRRRSAARARRASTCTDSKRRDSPPCAAWSWCVDRCSGATIP